MEDKKRLVEIPADGIVRIPVMRGEDTVGERRVDLGFLPAVDAVEVVRCKDCKHYDNSEGIQWCHLNSKFAKWGTDWHSFPEDGFCSYGERRTDA